MIADFSKLVSRAHYQKRFPPSYDDFKKLPLNAPEEERDKEAASTDSEEINRLLQEVKTKLTSKAEALLQQDADQLILKLLDIQRDCTTAFHNSKGRYEELSLQAEADQHRSASHVESSIVNLNTIELTWCLQCHRKKAVTKDPYPIFPLPMQDEQGNEATTIAQAFELFGKTKLIEHDCENCEAAVSCSRQVVCGPTPKVLIINLQSGKQGCYELPLYFQLPGTQSFYRLICFICHIGQVIGYVASSGHYDAYMLRKSSTHPQGDKWYLSDDQAKTKNLVWELATREIRAKDKPYLCFFDLMTKPPTKRMMEEKFLRARTGKGSKN